MKPFISEENKDKKNKDRTIRDIWKLFETEEKKRREKEIRENEKTQWKNN